VCGFGGVSGFRKLRGGSGGWGWMVGSGGVLGLGGCMGRVRGGWVGGFGDLGCRVCFGC
jgi:hypothetical protein